MVPQYRCHKVQQPRELVLMDGCSQNLQTSLWRCLNRRVLNSSLLVDRASSCVVLDKWFFDISAFYLHGY